MMDQSNTFLVLAGLLVFAIIAYWKNTQKYRANFPFRDGGGNGDYASKIPLILFLIGMYVLTNVFHISLDPYMFAGLFIATIIIAFTMSKRYTLRKKQLYENEKKNKR